MKVLKVIKCKYFSVQELYIHKQVEQNSLRKPSKLLCIKVCGFHASLKHDCISDSLRHASPYLQCLLDALWKLQTHFSKHKKGILLLILVYILSIFLLILHSKKLRAKNNFHQGCKIISLELWSSSFAKTQDGKGFPCACNSLIKYLLMSCLGICLTECAVESLFSRWLI